MTLPGEALVLAVDGGGTKTELAFADRSGEIVFRAQGAGTNPMDNKDWRQELGRLFSSADEVLASTIHAVFGLPGFGEVTHLDGVMLSAAAELFRGPRHVMNDVELALSGAFLGQAGILVLAGTGSMAMARDVEGNIVRVGGWGEMFGDEGSAYWIGRRALGETSQALDGRLAAVDFAHGILAGLGLAANGSEQDLMALFYGAPNPRTAVAAVARIVDVLARSGDRTALAILHEAADHLGAHMAAVLRRAGVASAPWSFAGGVFESAEIRRVLTERHGAPAQPRLVAVGGGLWRAATEAGWAPSDSWIARLAVSLVKTKPASIPSVLTTPRRRSVHPAG